MSRAFAGYTYAHSMRCERGNCPERATHLVYIWFSDAPEEIWRVCRTHDRDLKLAFPRGRPRPEQIEEPSSSPRVHCRQCDQPLDEAVADVRDEGSHPCPYCGSLKRHVRVRLADFGIAHESLRVRSKQSPGKGRWLKDTTSGDSYTRDLDAWGRRTVEKDYDNNQYRELIELYDGSWLESTAMLDNHHDLFRVPCTADLEQPHAWLRKKELTLTVPASALRGSNRPPVHHRAWRSHHRHGHRPGRKLARGRWPSPWGWCPMA